MSYTVDAAHIFTFFFIMLGPIKMIIPYARATQRLDGGQLRSLSLKSAALGTIIAIAGGFVGQKLLESWGIPVPVLLMGAGIIFFLVALGIVLPHPAPPVPADDLPPPNVMQVVFPMILTPYGLAALIAFLASSTDTSRTLTVLGLLLINMVLNLLCMIFVRPILKLITPTGMQILFAVLGVLMVGLALEIIIEGARYLNIIPPMPMAG
jgi:multiple antibiotic resistance protein